jgi:hypothetical protein
MSKKVFIIIVTFIFITPSVFNFINLADKTNENRNLKPRPDFSFNNIENSGNPFIAAYYEVINYKDEYDKYYTSNFSLKKPLFKPYYFIQKNILHKNPLPEKVVNGKDGWMFLGDSYSNVISESRGLLKFNEKQVNLIRKNVLSATNYLKENDIFYYLAIAPNKHSIYGDKLFNTNYNGETKKTQVHNALSNYNLKLIDLGKGFDEIEEQLFFKTNTHWNDLGAYYGYKNLMKTIKREFKNIKSVSLNEVDIETKISWKEDLTNMLDIRVKEIGEYYTIKNPKSQKIKSRLTIPDNYKRKPETYERRYKSNSNDIKVLIFRDSFSTAMEKYLAESFGETVFIFSSIIDKDLIQKEKPDLIIHEIIERNIDVLLKS